MSLDVPTPEREFDESVWIYLAVARGDASAGGQTLTQMLADACEHLGFVVYASERSATLRSEPPYWMDAVRHADVCVIDLGAASAITGAELATAYCASRPVVALRARDEIPPAPLVSLAEHYPAVREVVFDDPQDCVEQLTSVLRDPSWQEVVRRATHADSM